MGRNILFWNCQDIRPERKELELYLKENVIGTIALNETFLSKKHNFKIPGYDTIRNDRHSTGQRGGAGCCLPCENGQVLNKGKRNDDFNIITLAIDLELSYNQTSLLQPFTDQMEILTFHLFEPSTTYLTVSCLSEVSIRN